MDEKLENQNGGEEQEGEKLFTQAELDAIISKRVNAAKKGMPGADELAEFRTWKQTHTDADTKLQTITGERDTAQSELEMAKREIFLLKQGIPADDVDYYVYKITKAMDDDTEFEDAAKAFLKDHKRKTVHMDTGARLNGDNGGTKSWNDKMNELIRSAK